MNRKGYIWTFVLTLYVSLCLGQAPLDTICIFEPPSNLAVPYQAGHKYQWNVNGGQIISQPDSNAILVDWSGASAGLASIWVVAINESTGCPGDTSYSNMLITAPQKARAKAPTEVCQGDWVSLESSMQGPYAWEDGSSDKFFEFKATHDTTVSLVALNGECDNDTLEFYIKVNETPTAGINSLPDTVQRLSDLKLYFTGTGNTSSQVQWFLNGYSEGFGSVLSLTMDQYGKNEIAQIVKNGDCADTLWKDVFVDNQYTAFFPNSFTPNGDGKNDYWHFGGLGHQSFRAEIYNRWGELVFAWSSDDEVPGWDGTNRGEKSMIGAYIYKVEITDLRGENHNYQDHFTLIR